VVVVHRGARDAYEVSRALAGAGLLERLVTDLYWPADRAWAKRLSRVPLLSGRNNPGLPSSLVEQLLLSGLTSFALDKIKLPRVPFSWRRRATRWADASLGREAARIATETESLLLSYSYYAYHAFSNFSGPRALFQLHPHPVSVREILTQELADHPDCAASLRKEWELSLPAEDFERLVLEPKMAERILVASSFTKRTLIENGIPASAITVIPYGVNLRRFTPRARNRSSAGPLRLLFVGTINQRKGIKYLVEALRVLLHREISLTICGRVVDDLSVLKPIASQIDLRPSISPAELVSAYQQADLFVLPSVAEGFGQVLLEALACGLPVLSTRNTAAPDLLDEGVHGFVVAPRRSFGRAHRMGALSSFRPRRNAPGRSATRRKVPLGQVWPKRRRLYRRRHKYYPGGAGPTCLKRSCGPLLSSC
jgi:glycosyltransferase involved in cell wall biosynthesis